MPHSEKYTYLGQTSKASDRKPFPLSCEEQQIVTCWDIWPGLTLGPSLGRGGPLRGPGSPGRGCMSGLPGPGPGIRAQCTGPGPCIPPEAPGPRTASLRPRSCCRSWAGHSRWWWWWTRVPGAGPPLKQKQEFRPRGNICVISTRSNHDH